MVLLVAGWVVLLGQPTFVSTKLRMIFVQLSTPFVRLGDYIPTVKSRRDLDKQNRELRAENQELRLKVRTLTATVEESIRFNRTAALKERPPYRTLGARVIGHDAANWWKSIQIDRGTDDGLRENLAVINADGVIGKTVKVTRTEARVLLLIDPNCKASALLQSSRETGVCAGTDSAEPTLLMTYVTRGITVRPGERILTSGLGGVFPKGLPIGTVTKVQLNKQTGMYQDLTIQPVVDFRRLEEVLVVVE